jgi:hypothetical protein
MEMEGLTRTILRVPGVARLSRVWCEMSLVISLRFRPVDWNCGREVSLAGFPENGKYHFNVDKKLKTLL